MNAISSDNMQCNGTVGTALTALTVSGALKRIVHKLAKTYAQTSCVGVGEEKKESNKTPSKYGGLPARDVHDAPYELLQDNNNASIIELLSHLGSCMTACLEPSVRKDRTARVCKLEVDEDAEKDQRFLAFLRIIHNPNDHGRYNRLRQRILKLFEDHLSSLKEYTRDSRLADATYLACALSTLTALATATRGASGSAEMAADWWHEVGEQHCKDLLDIASADSLPGPRYLDGSARQRHAFSLLRTRLFKLLIVPFREYVDEYDHYATHGRNTLLNYLREYIATHTAMLLVEMENFFVTFETRIAVLLQDSPLCLTLSTWNAPDKRHCVDNVQADIGLAQLSTNSSLRSLSSQNIEELSSGVNTPEQSHKQSLSDAEDDAESDANSDGQHDKDERVGQSADQSAHNPRKRARVLPAASSVSILAQTACATFATSDQLGKRKANIFNTSILEARASNLQSPYHNVCGWLRHMNKALQQELTRPNPEETTLLYKRLMRSSTLALNDLERAYGLQGSGTSEDRPSISINARNLVRTCTTIACHPAELANIGELHGVADGNRWNYLDTLRSVNLGKLLKSGVSVSNRKLARALNRTRDVRARNYFTYRREASSAAMIAQKHWMQADTQVHPTLDRLDQNPAPNVLLSEQILLERWVGFLSKIKTIAVWHDFLSNRYVDLLPSLSSSNRADKVLQQDMQDANQQIVNESKYICGRDGHLIKRCALAVTIPNSIATNIHFKEPPTNLAAPIAGSTHPDQVMSDPRRAIFCPSERLLTMLEHRGYTPPIDRRVVDRKSDAWAWE